MQETPIFDMMRFNWRCLVSVSSGRLMVSLKSFGMNLRKEKQDICEKYKKCRKQKRKKRKELNERTKESKQNEAVVVKRRDHKRVYTQST